MPRKITTRKTSNVNATRTPRSKPFGQSADKTGESRRADEVSNVDRGPNVRDPGSLDEETLSSDAPYNKTYGGRKADDTSRVPSTKSGTRTR